MHACRCPGIARSLLLFFLSFFEPIFFAFFVFHHPLSSWLDVAVLVPILSILLFGFFLFSFFVLPTSSTSLHLLHPSSFFLQRYPFSLQPLSFHLNFSLLFLAIFSIISFSLLYRGLVILVWISVPFWLKAKTVSELPRRCWYSVHTQRTDALSRRRRRRGNLNL